MPRVTARPHPAPDLATAGTTGPRPAWLPASGSWRDEESARLRAAFRARFCEFDDGWAAERVVRTLILGEVAWTPSAPTPPARPRAVTAQLPAQSCGHDRLAPS
ncbi:hypothetical protein GCM10014715_54160 [Streptomyces spiralis]|uniref:Uncharacterized protein n=1 Tax=Streptomyces spiralis TaxID=66376 RepID=A0A919A7P2_9ACTN|nr:hypothetical protein GCM10014715_54160 [Streptomyces spiralis]